MIVREMHWLTNSSCSGLATIYKFHNRVKAAPGGVVSVWSSDSGKEHIPKEGQLVMKEGAWKFGESVETVLENQEGDLVATRETKKVKESFGSSKRFAGRRSGAASKEGEKCSIM